MVDLAGPILQSLLLGSLYAMMALGLTMTYRVTKVPNFAHAEYVTIGGYVMVAGENAMEGTGQEILNDESLKRIFLGGK
ncbi:MAG: hypothetical protein V3U33_02760 [candidate division NC10 bacterium]